VFSGFHTNFHCYSQHYRAGCLRQVIFRYLCRFHNRTGGTLVPSPDLCDRLRAFGFHNVSVLGRGVDSQLFAPERRCGELRSRWGAAEDDLVVLYVGRVAPEKNLGLAVAAYRAMQRSGAPVKFVIVGDGPLGATLRRDQADVIFCGVHTGQRLATHYASADVFLFPSETETFGNVTLEAMASGLAVVAYDYAAAKMHIRHGETGVLVPYGDSQGFVEAAARLACEPHALHKIRRQAREYATALSWQRVVERFATLLTGALGQNVMAPNSSRTRRSWAAEPQEGG
jgi:glycosyltransferase involved in cell wall biosynthesis